MSDPEIIAMQKISEALSTLEKDAIDRVLSWANSRFLATKLMDVTKAPEMINPTTKRTPQLIKTSTEENSNEIPGIALREENGSIRFTLRDIKANSAVDAGVRLALIASYVCEKLTGQKELSRKEILNPLLKNWRVYDGNTRKYIAAHKGIISISSDKIKLDTPAMEEATKIIEELQNPEISGRWSPTNAVRKKKAKGNKGTKKQHHGSE